MNRNNIDKCANVINHDIMSLDVDGKNGAGFFLPDLLENVGDEFRNYGGYPRNELAIIQEQQSAEVAKALAERIAVLPDDTQVPSKVSDEDLKLSLRSRYQQTISEQIAFTENVLRIRDERLQEKKDAAAVKAAEEKARQEQLDLWNSLTPEEREEIQKKKREKMLETLIES